jgi:diacylglycerol kinase (ATP)
VEKESVINFESQNFSDGKLEFLTFSSSLGLAQERIFKGQAKRVGQGAGPFQLNFKKADNNDLPLKTYFQIDGEYYEIIAPKMCKINICSELPNGKIKVLVDKNSKP